jgi:hypothetical protein
MTYINLNKNILRSSQDERRAILSSLDYEVYQALSARAQAALIDARRDVQ